MLSVREMDAASAQHSGDVSMAPSNEAGEPTLLHRMRDKPATEASPTEKHNGLSRSVRDRVGIFWN